jgi:hypothetical protein
MRGTIVVSGVVVQRDHNRPHHRLARAFRVIPLAFADIID